MKSIIIQVTVTEDGNSVSKNIRVRTNVDNHEDKFTIMQIVKPIQITAGEFPFREGDVFNFPEFFDEVSMLNARGFITVTSVKVEDGDSQESITLPVIKKVTITVTNAGAKLTVDGEEQKGLSWIGHLHKGESVTYVAELKGYTTQTKTLTVNNSNITESVTLESAS